jgi:hypothetical protein
MRGLAKKAPDAAEKYNEVRTSWPENKQEPYVNDVVSLLKPEGHSFPTTESCMKPKHNWPMHVPSSFLSKEQPEISAIVKALPSMNRYMMAFSMPEDPKGMIRPDSLLQ